MQCSAEQCSAVQWHHKWAGTSSLLEEQEFDGAVQLASEWISSPDGVGSGGVQLVPVAPHLAVHINEKHSVVPDSVSDCKCAVVDNVCAFSWTNCEWLQNTSGENQYFVENFKKISIRG